MANVRIKDLSTTASTTASDDFFGVDGATNGTRKLAAYSPTFGGNLTVSGTGTSSVAGSFDVTGPIRHVGAGGGIVGIGSSSTVGIINSVGGGGLVIRGRSGTNNDLTISNSDGSVTLLSNLTVSGGTITSGSGTLTLNSSANTVVLQSAGTTALTLDASQNATFAGQINGNAGYRFRGATGTFYELLRYVGGSNNPGLYVRATEATGAIRLDVSGSSGPFPFEIASGGTLAATFNGANATFAGSIAIGNTVQTAVAVASTHKVTISIGGSTYYLLATNV